MTRKRKIRRRAVWPHKLEVRITDRVNDALDRYAKDHEIKKSEVVRNFLAEGLQKLGYLVYQEGGENK